MLVYCPLVLYRSDKFVFTILSHAELQTDSSVVREENTRGILILNEEEEPHFSLLLLMIPPSSFRGALPRIIRHAGGDLGRRVRPLVARQLLHARHLLRARVQGAAARKLGLPQRSRLRELAFRHVNANKSYIYRTD